MSNMKIKVLSPVHIGTGETIACFCYEASGKAGIVNCYDPREAMAAVPANLLLDPDYLDLLSKAKSGNEQRNDRIIRKINYGTLKPRYQVNVNGGLNYYDTAVQTKSLNRPYIPGSTIKGTIIHALLYRWIKEHYKDSNIEDIIVAGKPNSFSAKNLFDEILGSKIYTVLSNALLCEDVFFGQITLYQRVRINSRSGDIPLPNCEALTPGQSIEQAVFTIQKDRLNLQLDSGLTVSEQAVEFIDSLSEEYILEALRIEAEDNLQIEMDYNYGSKDIEDQLRQLRAKVKQSCIMRTGNSTDYWEKSISYLVKKNNPQFYRENFIKKFSPLGSKLSPERMPLTRVILFDELGEYLAGYLEITQ